MAVILIIDDDQQMRRLISRILRGAGHVPHEAGNGREGMELSRKVRPALVITDILMPEQEGIETIRELRRAIPGLPILAVSGGDNPLYLRAATSLGAVAALEKPFSADELISLVSELLDEKS